MIWRKLHDWASRHALELGLALRVTVAAVAALAIAQALQLRLPLWAVLTAVFVTQASVGRSLKATIDYVIGTLAGVAYGGAVAVLFPHSSESALLAVLAISVAPLALLAAIKPNFTVAPITAVIVILVPTITHTNTVVSAVDRVLEVVIGGLTGLIVSFLLFPSRAHAQAVVAAARALDEMARVLNVLIDALEGGIDLESLHRIQETIGLSLGSLNTLAAEAERERAAGIARKTQTGPMVRTLLRLRHDLIILGRTAREPLPVDLQARLRPALEQIRAAVSKYLRASGAALIAHRKPPQPEEISAAFDAFESTLRDLRTEGATRSLSADAVERFFTFGFAFDQMRRNLADLERCVTEWADVGSTASTSTEKSDYRAP